MSQREQMAAPVLLASIMVGGFAFLAFQISRVDARIDALGARIDAIPRQLTEEFQAMRAEMSAQTSAIANAIDAAKQAPP